METLTAISIHSPSATLPYSTITLVSHTLVLTFINSTSSLLHIRIMKVGTLLSLMTAAMAGTVSAGPVIETSLMERGLHKRGECVVCTLVPCSLANVSTKYYRADIPDDNG